MQPWSACEQAFSWLNHFKNLKTMNEGRFKMFLMFLIDLHKHHLKNTLAVGALSMLIEIHSTRNMLIESASMLVQILSFLVIFAQPRTKERDTWEITWNPRTTKHLNWFVLVENYFLIWLDYLGIKHLPKVNWLNPFCLSLYKEACTCYAGWDNPGEPGNQVPRKS